MSVRNEFVTVLGVSTLSLLFVGAAWAADNLAAAETDQLDVIVVTAQRRAEDVEKIPISVSAVSGNALAAAGISNVMQLGDTVPGLNLEDEVGNVLVFIRGVGTTALSVENDVGVYLDGVYMTSQTASVLNLSNIDHIEVLKGPQGTLFGRNAVGGALSIVTKDPSQTPALDASVGYANYNTTTMNMYGTTGITPILATDFAFYYNNQASGWGRDLTTGVPNFRDRSMQARNKWALTPGDSTKITFSVDYALNHSEIGAQWHFLPGAVGLDGTSTFKGFYNSLGDGLSQNQEQQYGAMLRIDQDFGWAKGVSISSDRSLQTRDFIDQDATPLPVVEAGLAPQNDRAYSQELQLLSPDSSKMKWIAGAYYLYDLDYTPGFNIFVGPAPPLTHEVLIVREPTTSVAGFGQTTFEVLPDTHVTLGLRYTDDHKSISGQTLLNGVLLPSVIPGVTSPSRQSEVFTKFTYRAVLDHQFTPDILGYVSFDTGFKSGQYNEVAYTNPAVRPEALFSWQAGVKSEFMDHRLRFNAAAFHYNYSNIQITRVQEGSVVLLNAAAAKIYGLDLDGTAVITPDFKIQAAFTYLHGRYTDFPDAPSYLPNVSPVTGLPVGANHLVTIDATGNTTVHTPNATAYVAADYTISTAAVGKFELNVTESYNSGYYWDPDNRLKQPAYALLGAFVKWYPKNQNWNLRLWGNNITNRQYYSYEEAFAFGDIGSPVPPATYGITADFHF